MINCKACQVMNFLLCLHLPGLITSEKSIFCITARPLVNNIGLSVWHFFRSPAIIFTAKCRPETPVSENELPSVDMADISRIIKQIHKFNWHISYHWIDWFSWKMVIENSNVYNPVLEFQRKEEFFSSSLTLQYIL